MTGNDCIGCSDCPLEIKRPDNFYEIHITVKLKKSLDDFKEFCQKIDVKPILIELEGEPEQVMISAIRKFGDTRVSMVLESNDVVMKFREAGYKVLREKIELSPWHVLTPSSQNSQKVEYGKYFEGHLKINLKSDEEHAVLKNACSFYNLHLSKNAFKKDSGSFTYMATGRSKDENIEAFKERMAGSMEALKARGYDVQKSIIEYTWYDSNIYLDGNWAKI